MMDNDVGRAPAGQALVSDEARSGLHPSGFDPSRKSEYFDAFKRVAGGVRRLTELDPEAGDALDIAMGELRAGDIAAGRTDGMAWYADYVQRIAAIRDRAYWEHPYGDAGDALDFACDHCGPEEALAFLNDWRGDLAGEWPGYMRWLKVQQDGAKASAIEARRAETAQHGSVADESASPKDDAQPNGGDAQNDPR